MSLFIAVPVTAALDPRRSSALLEELGGAGMRMVGPAGPSLGGVWNLVCVLDVRCRMLGVVRRMSCVICHRFVFVWWGLVMSGCVLTVDVVSAGCGCGEC